jgi:tetratricopeptide (TPR) repeat protein
MMEGAQLLNSGRFREAVETLRPLDVLFSSRERNALEYAEFCNMFGGALTEAGEMALAEERLKAAVALFADLGETAGQIEATLNLGTLYRYLNSRQRTVDCYRSSLELARGIGARREEGRALLALSFFWLYIGADEQACETLDELDALPPDPTNPRERWSVLSQRASMAKKAGDLAEALALLTEAAALAADLEDPGCRVETETGIAMLRSQLKHDDSAAPKLDAGPRAGGGWREIEALASMAQHSLQTGELEAAWRYFEECLSLIHRISAGLTDPTSRYHLADWSAQIAHEYCAALVAHGYGVQGLAAAERAQGSALLQMMFAHQRRRQGGRSIRCTAGGSLLLDVPTGEEIAQTLRDDNLHLLRLLDPPGRGLLAWYAGPDGEVFAWDASAARPHLNELIGLLLEANRPDDAVPRPFWSAVESELGAVYEALFGHNDARARLEERTGRLLIVPHLAWFHIPWHALGPRDGDPIGARWEITLAPSLGVYLQLDPARDPTPRLPDTFGSPVDAFGGIGSQIVKVPTLPIPNPPMTTLRFQALPRTCEEARTVAQILGGQSIEEMAATGQRVLRALTKARIVHLATHGYWHPVEGGLAFVLVAPDPAGSSDARLFGLALQNAESIAELAVLSACQTGIGALHLDSYINLPHSLLIGGVRAVLTTLWPVDDTFAKTFFASFYTSIHSGASPASALQSTQEKFRDMVDGWDWAAFILTGWGFALTGTRQPARGPSYAGDAFTVIGVPAGEKIPDVLPEEFELPSIARVTFNQTTKALSMGIREDLHARSAT